jgi:hypothetical protein
MLIRSICYGPCDVLFDSNIPDSVNSEDEFNSKFEKAMSSYEERVRAKIRDRNKDSSSHPTDFIVPYPTTIVPITVAPKINTVIHPNPSPKFESGGKFEIKKYFKLNQKFQIKKYFNFFQT